MKSVIRFLWLITLLGVTLSFPAKLGSVPDTRIRTKSSDIHIVHDQSDASEQVEEDEEEEEKRPYSFAWKASRYYNGNPDREHIEERGEDGITRGVFRFVDPRQQIQEVVYVSDDNGFQVEASNLPQDTPVVFAAKEKHLREFEKIRQEHERIGREHSEMAEEQE